MKAFEEKFSFPLFLRTFSILLALVALFWAIYYILFVITPSYSWFKKIVPFVVIFLVINVLYKNLFNVNSIIFKENYLILTYIFRRKKILYYNNIKRISFNIKPRKVILITYKQQDSMQIIKIPRGIKDIIKVINMIVKRSPDVEIDEFLATIVQSGDSKE